MSHIFCRMASSTRPREAVQRPHLPISISELKEIRKNSYTFLQNSIIMEYRQGVRSITTP